MSAIMWLISLALASVRVAERRDASSDAFFSSRIDPITIAESGPRRS